MKILFLSITSEIGGADLALLRTVRELNQTEFQPVVAFPQDGPLVSAFKEAGAETVFFPIRRLRKTFNPFWHLSYLSAFAKTSRSIAEFARESQVSIIHSNSLPNLYGGAAASRAQLPCVWHVRELDLRPRLVRAALARRALRQAQHIITVSNTVTRGVFGRPSGTAARKISVLYDALDVQAFRAGDETRAELRSRYNLEANAQLAGMWCRFDEWKGLPVAIKAAGIMVRDNPRFRLLVAGGPTAGHGQYAERLKALAEREAPGAVVFTGWLKPDEIPAYISGLDVAVHASTSPEPFGLVIAEAMATGTPLVAPRIGSPLELVEHSKDGLLYEAGHPTALAVAIKRFLDNEQLARSCAQSGREKAEELFDIRKNVRKLEDIYRGLVEGGKQ